MNADQRLRCLWIASETSTAHIFNNFRRAIRRSDSANGIVGCAVLFLQTTIACFRESNLPVDHPRQILYLGAHACAALRDRPARCLCPCTILWPSIGRIAVHKSFLSVHQRVRFDKSNINLSKYLRTVRAMS